MYYYVISFIFNQFNIVHVTIRSSRNYLRKYLISDWLGLNFLYTILDGNNFVHIKKQQNNLDVKE